MDLNRKYWRKIMKIKDEKNKRTINKKNKYRHNKLKYVTYDTCVCTSSPTARTPKEILRKFLFPLLLTPFRRTFFSVEEGSSFPVAANN